MNGRQLMLLGALGLLGAGAVVLAQGLFDTPPAAARMPVAVAIRPIRPYTIISQDMVTAGDPLPVQDAVARGAYPPHAVVGLMTTAQIAPGTVLTGVNAKPVEEVRFVTDPGLEVVTFAAGVDRTVGGQLRPGHIINLYGYGRDRETNAPFTTLIEPRLWVVKVSAGASALSNATPRPDPVSGAYRVEGGDREGQATLITVAAAPQQAFHIIDTLGADGLSAWATLASNQTFDVASLATSVPRPTAAAGGAVTTPWPAIGMAPTAMPTLSILGFGGTSR